MEWLMLAATMFAAFVVGSFYNWQALITVSVLLAIWSWMCWRKLCTAKAKVDVRMIGGATAVLFVLLLNVIMWGAFYFATGQTWLGKMFFRQ